MISKLLPAYHHLVHIFLHHLIFADFEPESFGVESLDQWQSYKKQGDMGSQDIGNWRKVLSFLGCHVSSSEAMVDNTSVRTLSSHQPAFLQMFVTFIFYTTASIFKIPATKCLNVQNSRTGGSQELWYCTTWHHLSFCMFPHNDF